MPTALPGLSAGKAAELLQQTDRLIKTVPEVARCSARRAAPILPPTRRRWRCSRRRSSSSRARMARGHDTRRPGRGARSHRPRAGPGQHLGAADPQSHRHARHRHQEPGRHQGRGTGPGAHRRPDGRSRLPSKPFPACPRRLPNGFRAAATSTSTSPQGARRATGLRSTTCSAHQLRRSAART